MDTAIDLMLADLPTVIEKTTPSEEELSAKEFIDRHGDDEMGGFDPLLNSLHAAHMPTAGKNLSYDEMRFASLVANTGSIRDAYSQVFDVTALTPQDISKYANALAKRKLVAQQIIIFRKSMVRQVRHNLPSILDLVDEAVDMGRQMNDPKVLLTAVDKYSNLLGLGESNKAKEPSETRLVLDEETRNIFLNQLRQIESPIIDITPTSAKDM